MGWRGPSWSGGAFTPFLTTGRRSVVVLRAVVGPRWPHTTTTTRREVSEFRGTCGSYHVILFFLNYCKDLVSDMYHCMSCFLGPRRLSNRKRCCCRNLIHWKQQVHGLRSSVSVRTETVSDVQYVQNTPAKTRGRVLNVLFLFLKYTDHLHNSGKGDIAQASSERESPKQEEVLLSVARDRGPALRRHRG